MANRRLKLHNDLIDNVLESGNEEVSRAYFQPDTSVNLIYPCVKYSLTGIDSKRADDRRYMNTDRYELTLIDYDPESPLHDKILNHFQMISFDRAYTADGLNHKVYTLYY